MQLKNHQIPTLEDLTSKLAGMSYFTVFDIKEGFYKIKLDKESSNLCAFSTPFGYGFGDLEGIFIYINDILITGKSKYEHNQNLSKFLQRAMSLNIKFNETKLQYKVTRVHFLGHIFSTDGVSPDPERIKAITEMPDPENKKDLQRFLGMIKNLFQSKISPKST